MFFQATVKSTKGESIAGAKAEMVRTCQVPNELQGFELTTHRMTVASGRRRPVRRAVPGKDRSQRPGTHSRRAHWELQLPREIANSIPYRAPRPVVCFTATELMLLSFLPLRASDSLMTAQSENSSMRSAVIHIGRRTSTF